MSPPTVQNSAPHRARGGHSGECQRVEHLCPPHQVNWLGAAYGLLWSPTCFPLSCYCHYHQHRASQGPPGRCCRGAGPQRTETMILSWLLSFAESSGAEEDGGVPCGPCSSLAGRCAGPQVLPGLPSLHLDRGRVSAGVWNSVLGPGLGPRAQPQCQDHPCGPCF